MRRQTKPIKKSTIFINNTRDWQVGTGKNLCKFDGSQILIIPRDKMRAKHDIDDGNISHSRNELS